MTESVFSILVPGVVIAAVGIIIMAGIRRKYRRQLGLQQETAEKTQDVSFIISAFQDVTRQLKEKEQELERLKLLAESRAENILQCVSNGVITFDGYGKVNTVNRAAEELLGRERADLLGKTCAEVFDNGELCRIIDDALERRVTLRRMETAMVRKGERVWLGFNTALLTDRQGTSLGAILSFSDLTEVKRLEEQVELRERLSALGEMSAGIAHELRNPMAVIVGYLNILAKKQDAAGQAVIGDIQEEISGMNRIISDLLAFARPTALNRTQVAMGELLDASVGTVLQARKGSGSIQVALDLGEGSISADEVLMRQAVGNLVQNAVDAMPEGGSLFVSVQGGREVTITVKDSGTGIPPEHIKRIFLPFFTTKDRGVGMGLALTHKIVTAHGGRIEVESVPAKGTTFTVSLPAS